MIAGDALRARLRTWAPTATRLAGAGVLGSGIGVASRRAELADAVATARELGQLPVWESARMLVDALARLSLPAWWPVAALLVLGSALATVALRLWRAPAPAPALAVDRAAQVPTLAADGLARVEIARRTGLSRDAVALSLHLQARQL